MGLNSLLASLKRDVSAVSTVQPCIHGGFGRYGIETADVSDVSATAAPTRLDTSDTVAKPQAYQTKALPLLTCTPDTSDTAQKINTERDAANDLVSFDDPAQEQTFPAILTTTGARVASVGTCAAQFVLSPVRAVLYRQSAVIPPAQCSGSNRTVAKDSTSGCDSFVDARVPVPDEAAR